MHCSQCKAEVVIDAKFCHKCGNSVEPPSSPATSKPIGVPEPLSLEPANPVSDWFAILWTLRFASVPIVIPIVIGVLLSGLYFFMFMCLWFGNFNTSIGYAFIFWNSLAFCYYWKRFNRRGWVGVLVGIAVSFAFMFLVAFISGYMRVLSQ